MFIKGMFTGRLVSIEFGFPVFQVIRPRVIKHLKGRVVEYRHRDNNRTICRGTVGNPSIHLDRSYKHLGFAFGISMPSFWWAILLILLFSVQLRLLPSGGGGGIKHMILPAIVLGTAAASIIARMTRSSMLDVLGQDYITTSRAKGLRRKAGHLQACLRGTLLSPP